MKIAICHTLFVIIFCFNSAELFAQTAQKATADTSSHKAKVDSTKRTEWDLTLDYYTRSVFLGRTDSIGSGYYLPAIALNLKSGFFFSIAPTLFEQNTVRAYQGLSLMAGYDKAVSSNFDIDIQLIKNSFPTTSTRINSTVTFEGEAAVDYINEIVTSELNFQLLVNKSALDNSPDFITTLTESHPFYLYAMASYKDSLSITPTASASAGTQNFYFSYFNTKYLSEHPKRLVRRTALVSAEKILDYELSVPINYYLGHFIFNITPLYSIGENIIGRTTPLDLWSADIGIGYRWW